MTTSQGRNSGAGQGSYDRLPSGRHRCRFTATGADGQSRRYTLTASTYRELQIKVAEARRRAAAGAPVKDSEILFGVFAEQWIRSALPAGSRALSTVELYADLTRNHLIPRFGKVRLRELRASHVDAMIVALRKTESRTRPGRLLAPSTCHTIYVVLCQILNTAVRDDLVEVNVAAKVDPPRVPHNEAAYLDREQLAAVREAASTTHHLKGEQRPSPMLEDLIIVLAGTATRRGEALGLRWPMVDLDTRTAKVHHSLGWRRGELQEDGTRPPGRLDLGTTKGGRMRTVMLSPPVIAALRRQHARQAAERLALGAAWVDSGYVFTTPLGTCCDPSNALKRYKAAAQAAGVPGTVHSLRHTNATAGLGVGVDRKTLATALGHSTVAMMDSTYGHSPDERQRAAADLIAAALGL